MDYALPILLFAAAALALPLPSKARVQAPSVLSEIAVPEPDR